MCIHILDHAFLDSYKYCQNLYLSVIIAVLAGIQHTMSYFMFYIYGQTQLFLFYSGVAGYFLWSFLEDDMWLIW